WNTFERLVQLVPDDLDLLAELIRAYRMAERDDAAIARLRDLARIAPERAAHVAEEIAAIEAARNDSASRARRDAPWLEPVDDPLPEPTRIDRLVAATPTARDLRIGARL